MNLERIASLLAQDLKPSQVASIVGCTPARISQLLKESTELQNLLALKQAEQDKEEIEEVALGAKYHAAEHALLDQVLSMAPMAELRDVTQALRVVGERQDKAKARKNPIPVQGGSGNIYNTVVQLNLPNHALPEVILNKEREVIAIDNNNLAPMTSEAVTNLFQTMKKGKDDELSRLPPPPKESSTTTITEEVRKQLDSFEPAPYAEVF